MSHHRSNDRFLNWAPRLVVVGFGVAALAQANVQIFSREKLLDLGEKSGRFLVKRVDFSRRGTVLSSDGRPLAIDEDAAEFGVLFDKVPDSPAFFMALSRATGVPAAEFASLKASGVKRAFWPEPLSRQRAMAVQDVKTAWRADGISVKATGRRLYPLEVAASCLLGYVREGKAVAGLELAQNDLLAGADGFTVGLTDRQGRFLPMRLDPRTRMRRDGSAITLTIDSELQLAATSALKSAVESNRADSGSAVVLDPNTGDVLAMANWPSFHPERPSESPGLGERFSDFNPNYMAAFEPGSTFKILTLALALEEGRVRPDEHVQCSGGLEVWPGRQVRCDLHGGTRAHGQVSPMLAIAKSCNVSAATWALRVGYEPFVRFLDGSGLMAKTQLGLPLERAGEFNRNEYAKRLQLATFGFGQSMTCTPLGLASAFSSLANGGVRMEPRLIKRIGDRDTAVKKAGRLFSKETAAKVMEFMEAVIETDVGTGKRLRIPGYRLAGKTGTAQKINSLTGTVEGGGYVSNFVGVVPANEPRAVILVMIDNPKAGRYYGATVAGPVFLEIARTAIRRLDIPGSPGGTSPPRQEPSAAQSSPEDPLVGAGGGRAREPEVSIESRRVPLLGAKEKVSP